MTTKVKPSNFAWHLVAFDENFPAYMGRKYYHSFRGGLIYYAFATEPMDALDWAKQRIAELNLNLSAQVVRKTLYGKTEWHLIITVKGYHYERH